MRCSPSFFRSGWIPSTITSRISNFDIRARATKLRALLKQPLVSRIVADLQTELLRSPELASSLRPLQAQYRGVAATILQRAIARGEITAETDMDMATDALFGIIYWRMIVSQGPVDDKYLERLAKFIVAALASF